MGQHSPGLLEQARRLARTAHAGQTYNGRPYAEHPGRVADGVTRLTDDPLAPVVAWLHDVVEDTPVTLAEAERLFGPEVAADLDRLTRRGGEAYGDYLIGISGRRRALLVKLADLEDNLGQFADPACRKPAALRKKYLEARAFLVESLSRGGEGPGTGTAHSPGSQLPPHDDPGTSNSRRQVGQKRVRGAESSLG